MLIFDADHRQRALQPVGHCEKGSLVSFVRREELSRLMLTNPSISVGVLRVLAAKVRTARMALVER